MTNPSPASPAQPISDERLAQIRHAYPHALTAPLTSHDIMASEQRVISALLAAYDQQSAEIARLREAIKQWASECGECGGTGVIDGRQYVVEQPDTSCRYCAGIRAYLAAASVTP